MNWLLRSLQSSLGKKFLVAVTGLALLGFVVTHMLGNLQIFLGRDALNAYAAQLKALGGLLWVARAGLLAFFVVHVATAIRISLENRAARPVRYAVDPGIQRTVSARGMLVTGLTVFAFVLYHLAHFTWGWVMTDAHMLTETLADGTTRHDVFSMVVAGFQQPLIALLYVAAMVLLGLHIRHGSWSFVQTLGLNHHKFAPAIRAAAAGLAWLIVLGNISMPLAVLFGAIGLPDGVTV